MTSMNKGLVVAYARLSHDDLNKDISISIKHQLKEINDFAKSLNMKIDKEYIDDGYSGMNFARPAFNALKEDIKMGKISLVITKDISRLGRNFNETIYYISAYFYKYNVRYIAINDHYDTFNDNLYSEIFLKMKVIINDAYVHDVSLKRKSVNELYREKFLYWITKPPYGYHLQDKQLIIDKDIKNIIILIFKMKTLYYDKKEIANLLNILDIPNPSKKGKWNEHHIYYILRNKTYIGLTPLYKTIRYHYHLKRSYVPYDKREYLKTHEGMIDDKLFYQANKMIRRISKGSNVIDSLSDKVYCGECLRLMKQYHNTHKLNYRCNNTLCHNRSISTNKLNDILRSNLYNLLDQYTNISSLLYERIDFLSLINRVNIYKDHIEIFYNFSLGYYHGHLLS